MEIFCPRNLFVLEILNKNLETLWCRFPITTLYPTRMSMIHTLHVIEYFLIEWGWSAIRSQAMCAKEGSNKLWRIWFGVLMEGFFPNFNSKTDSGNVCIDEEFSQPRPIDRIRVGDCNHMCTWFERPVTKSIYYINGCILKSGCANCVAKNIHVNEQHEILSLIIL